MKRTALVTALLCIFTAACLAQRFAVLEPAAEGSVPGFAGLLTVELGKRTKMIDSDLAVAAYRSVPVEDPFNMSTDEGRRVGHVIGCDRFLILRTAVQRRAETGSGFYFEAYAITYLVDTRTGLMIDWRLVSAEADTEIEAAALLRNKAHELAAKIASVKDRSTAALPAFPEPPRENSPDAAGLKLPVPYKRIRPKYTDLAALYGIKATVDIEVDIDAEGRVGASRMVRWAGFGLDDEVERTVRSMNWRPAMRGGRSLPMRVLLRYNFRKVEKDEEN